MDNRKRSRRTFSLEYKRKIVEEYLTGQSSAQTIAEREDIDVGSIYKWRLQLEARKRAERIGTLESSGMSPDEARRYREMEEELEAYKLKVAEQAVTIDLLKKIHPSFQSENASSGYTEIKRKLVPSKGRAK